MSEEKDPKGAMAALATGKTAPVTGKTAPVTTKVTTRTDEETARPAAPPRVAPIPPVEDLVASLDPGVPVVLLPVRLETRFVPNATGARLLVRIYPDEIFADGHEPELTAEERSAGRAFHAAIAEGTAALDAWRLLTARFSATRSAWIARATAPGTADPGTREGTWTRAVRCALLPHRWRVRLLRHDGTDASGNPVARWHLDRDTNPVVPSLALTHAPPPCPPPGAPEGPTPLFDDGVLWTVDFQRAVDDGMAVVFELSRYDLERGIDRVLALGLRDATPEADADALAALLDAQHYTRGLGIVPQGTPAHNTPGRPAGYPPSDAPEDTFRIERDEIAVSPTSDGGRLARALGVEPRLFAHVAGSDRGEFVDAGAMNRALWPATLGYFLTQIVHPRAPMAAVLEARDWFEETVRAAGPLPTVRVGRVPYGVLPVSSLARWAARGDSPLEKWLVGALRALHAQVRRDLLPRVGRVAAPHLGRTEGDPDRDLLEVLRMDGGSRVVRVRPALGVRTRDAVCRELGVDPAEVSRRLGALQAVRSPSMASVAGRAAGFLYDLNAGRLTAPLVEPAESPDERARAARYLGALAEGGLRSLHAGWVGSGAPPLLYAVARHATLLERLRLVDEAATDPTRVLSERERAERGFVLDPEVLPDGEGATARLGRASPADDDHAVTHRAALVQLASRPATELERLLLETLDLCSHRVDAWQTALFTRRLDAMRSARSRGCHVGAFGFVERPAPRAPDARRSEGHVHAPSLDHAATAAVLLNAHLTRRGEEAERFRVDLSSARVRRALEVLDAVRSGQSLAAVLGYQVERDLLDRGLTRYIAGMREVYPVESSAAAAEGGALESVAARDVVDGLRLDAAARAGRWPVAVDDVHRAGVEAAFAALAATVDAVGDVLTAESVFQVVRGNPTGAGASLDAMARGHRPPEPEVVRTPRGGASATHRVMLVLPSGDEAAPGWPYTRTPRASLAPALDRWLGLLLGDPAEIRCRATWQEEGAVAERFVTARELDLCPLDLAALAREGVPEAPVDGAAQGFGTELERRLLARLPERAQKVSFDFEVEGRTFTEVFEVGRAVEDLLGGARPLRPSDLSLPERSPGEAPPPVAGRASTTVRSAVFALQRVWNELTEAPTAASLRAALVRASLFDLPSAMPESPDEPLPSLRARASRAAAEFYRRLLRAAGPALEGRSPAAVALPAALLGEASLAAQTRADTAPGEVVEALFGRRRMVLPDFEAPALRAPGAVDPAQVSSWLHAMWRVRAPLSRWRRVALYAGALGAQCPLEVAQLEPRPHGRWVALPLDEDPRSRGFVAPPSGCVSLVMAKPLPVRGAWSGVLLDEWTEVIPNARELTGIAFHHDDPGAEAPHAVLVAVPPIEGVAWTGDALFEAVDETLGLAQVRALGAAALGDFAQVLPAAYLSANAAGATVSTGFAGQLAADPAPPPARSAS